MTLSLAQLSWANGDRCFISVLAQRSICCRHWFDLCPMHMFWLGWLTCSNVYTVRFTAWYWQFAATAVFNCVDFIETHDSLQLVTVRMHTECLTLLSMYVGFAFLICFCKLKFIQTEFDNITLFVFPVVHVIFCKVSIVISLLLFTHFSNIRLTH
jgi:hypothetical protein